MATLWAFALGRGQEMLLGRMDHLPIQGIGPMRLIQSRLLATHGKTVLMATLLASVCFVEPVTAQPPPPSGLPSPRLAAVTPPGGKVGSTFEITFTGTDIEEPQALLFSQPGIKAEPVIPPVPAADPKKPGAKPGPRPPVTHFKVAIAPNTPSGIHDVRLVNHWGVSNARAFVVGDLAEVQEKEPNNDVPQAQRVELNCTINGAIAAPTDVDYFVFAGKKGQRVVITCLASSIDSRLMAALELYDSAGHQLAFNRHYHDNDALVDCTLPSDGDYLVRVYEFTHAEGTPEHFYRLSITTAPWIDAILPLAVEPGKTANLTVYGRNLPGGQLDPAAVENGSVLEKCTVTLAVPGDPAAQERLSYHGHLAPRASALDGFEYRIRNASGTSNPFLLTYARAPVILEKDAHQTPETAQELALPCEVSGRVEKLHDRDWYTFTAKQNQVYNIEVLSGRLGAQTDMYFLLRQVATKQDLAELDDNNDVLTQFVFYTRSEDPPVHRFTVPADGKYQLLVGSRDADTRAGPRQYYHLRIVPERPDFRLVVLPPDEARPDGCCLRQGGQEHYTVLAWRLDGWNGAISLTAQGLPKGVSCPTQVIAPNLRQTELVLSAAADATPWTGAIKLQGTATINGRTVVHEARPASITVPLPQPQAMPAVSRLERDLVLAVRGKAPFSLTASADKTTILQGAKANITLKLARLWPEFKTPLQVVPFDPPTHLPGNLTINNNQPLTMAPGKDTATAVLNVNSNVPPGTYNLNLRGVAQIPYNKDPKAKEKPNINVLQPATALMVTVLPQQVATLSVSNANPALKIGDQTELVVRVARMHDYSGEFKVQLVLPPNVKGVVADPITIPAGKDEAKLVLKAPKDAAAGSRPDLIVRAVATIAGNTPLTHETKINVNVTK
jgi:hypothetical protein